MTTCSSIASLGMMPLLLYVFCQGFPGLENAVPYGSIMKALVFTLVPCAAGILINHYTPKYSPLVKKVSSDASHRHNVVSVRLWRQLSDLSTGRPQHPDYLQHRGVRPVHRGRQRRSVDDRHARCPAGGGVDASDRLYVGIFHVGCVQTQRTVSRFRTSHRKSIPTVLTNQWPLFVDAAGLSPWRQVVKTSSCALSS